MFMSKKITSSAWNKFYCNGVECKIKEIELYEPIENWELTDIKKFKVEFFDNSKRIVNTFVPEKLIKDFSSFRDMLSDPEYPSVLEAVVQIRYDIWDHEVEFEENKLLQDAIEHWTEVIRLRSERPCGCKSYRHKKSCWSKQSYWYDGHIPSSMFFRENRVI